MVNQVETDETRFVAFTPVTNLLVVSTRSPVLTLIEYLYVHNRFSRVQPVDVLELFLRFVNDLVFAFSPFKVDELKRVWEVLQNNIATIHETIVTPADKFPKVLNDSLVCASHRMKELELNLDTSEELIQLPEGEIDAVIEFLTKFDEIDQVLAKKVISGAFRFINMADESNLSCWTPHQPVQYLRVWNCERDGLPKLHNFSLKIIAACKIHHNCTIAVSSDKVAVYDRSLCGK